MMPFVSDWIIGLFTTWAYVFLRLGSDQRELSVLVLSVAWKWTKIWASLLSNLCCYFRKLSNKGLIIFVDTNTGFRYIHTPARPSEHSSDKCLLQRFEWLETIAFFLFIFANHTLKACCIGWHNHSQYSLAMIGFSDFSYKNVKLQEHLFERNSFSADNRKYLWNVDSIVVITAVAGQLLVQKPNTKRVWLAILQVAVITKWTAAQRESDLFIASLFTAVLDDTKSSYQHNHKN